MDIYQKEYGSFGGRYVAEVLRKPLAELEDSFRRFASDREFLGDFQKRLNQFVGRPTPLFFAGNLTRECGGAQIYIKLEGLANTGAHKINNALGQVLLAKRMGKKRIIAETGAGQHGVATAAASAYAGIGCRVYMGAEDQERQRPNVFRMELFGAEVVSVESGARTLKDAVNAALRYWSETPDETYYLIGSALGPAPYPSIVRFFQSVIGTETAEQCEALGVEPDALVACVGGGSNAIGFFSPFIERPEPRLIGVEAGGDGEKHAARMSGDGKIGLFQGYKSYLLIDEDGQTRETHSIAAGLDYPGIGPQLAQLAETGRVDFRSATDGEALDAMKKLARSEGIICALESAHAVAHAMKIAPEMRKDQSVIVNMSGAGDKDIFITAPEISPESRKMWVDYLKKEADKHDR